MVSRFGVEHEETINRLSSVADVMAIFHQLQHTFRIADQDEAAGAADATREVSPEFWNS